MIVAFLRGNRWNQEVMNVKELYGVFENLEALEADLEDSGFENDNGCWRNDKFYITTIVVELNECVCF